MGRPLLLLLLLLLHGRWLSVDTALNTMSSSCKIMRFDE